MCEEAVTVAVIFAGIVLGLLILILLSPIRVQVWAKAMPVCATLYITITLLWFLKWNMRFQINILREPFLSAFWQRRNGAFVRLQSKGKNKKRRASPLPLILKIVRLQRIRLGVTLGLEGDPAKSAVLCGVLQKFLQTAVHAVAAYTEIIKTNAEVNIFCQPDFTADMLRLDLECMASVIPAHIIVAACEKRRLNHKGAMTNAASD